MILQQLPDLASPEMLLLMPFKISEMADPLFTRILREVRMLPTANFSFFVKTSRSPVFSFIWPFLNQKFFFLPHYIPMSL